MHCFISVPAVRQSSAAVFRSHLFRESIMIGSPPKNQFPTNRPKAVIGMPESDGSDRESAQDAVGDGVISKPGRLRIAEMNRWLSTK